MGHAHKFVTKFAINFNSYSACGTLHWCFPEKKVRKLMMKTAIRKREFSFWFLYLIFCLELCGIFPDKALLKCILLVDM